jgi:hypothetical protein
MNFTQTESSGILPSYRWAAYNFRYIAKRNS